MLKVCFTGYRPFKLPFKIDKTEEAYLRFCERAKKLLACQIEAGNRYFISGMAQGADMILASVVLELKKHYSGVYLECALPFEGQSDGWDALSRKQYAEIIKECDKVTVVSPKYSIDSFMQRNRYMIDSSDIVIAVYDGKKGGTKFTHDYAVKKGRTVILLSPCGNEIRLQSEIMI